MASRTLYLPEIGEVNFRKSKRNIKINITIKPPGKINVSLPERLDFAHAEKFVRNNMTWVVENLERIRKIKRAPEIIDETTNYKTRRHTLCFLPHKSKKAQYELADNRIIICYPQDANIHEESVQKVVKKGIDQALEVEAKDYLPERAEFLSQKTGLIYKDLSLFKSKKFWGMCMDDNSIKLNIHLMRLPDELIDYVILHEFSHIKEKNHSPEFYKVLTSLVPEHKILYERMKKYYPSRYK
jgi:predicted metal-dependent hydrolase